MDGNNTNSTPRDTGGYVLRYRLQGTRITYQGDQIYIFDLSAHEAFSPTTVVDGKRKAGKRVLPEEWADSFGTPVEEHDAFTKIDLSQGYQGTDFDASLDLKVSSASNRIDEYIDRGYILAGKCGNKCYYRIVATPEACPECFRLEEITQARVPMMATA